jgi:PAS domain S-box-containing protein
MNRLQVSGGLRNLSDSIAGLQRERLELQNRERAIVDAAEEMICCLSGELKFISVSMASEKILGYLPSELTGKNVADFALADESEKFLLFFRRVKSNQEGTTFEGRMLTKFAKPVDLRWEADWSESESCFFACARNITDIKNLERAKREFVAMIGHDIRVPVGSVLLGIQSVARGIFGEIPQAASKTLIRLENSLARLIALINELLDFEKAAAGKMSVSLQQVDLSEILSAVVVDTTDFSAQKGIKLQFSPRPVTIMGDAQKLHRVFLNLISNAIKFSNKDSSVEIMINIEPDFVEVKVTDHGWGITAANQRLVFERYERLDAEKSAVEGTGLGLAIAKAIVEAHDGMIGVESSPGSGSTFWVTLPIARAHV